MLLNGNVLDVKEKRRNDRREIYRILKNILVPTLHEGDIIVMDNIRSHHMKEVSEIINHSEKHLTLLYLPAYSPDFNPIEMMWQK